MAVTLVRAVEWVGGADGCLRLLDQTLLPGEVAYRDYRDVESVREAIRSLRMRGAPAIGVGAAFGLVVHMQQAGDDLAGHFEHGRERLGSSRPTAVNLAWALERMTKRFRRWQAEKQVA